ncbi:MAG: hypothetical protein QM755_17230 [Luteolibacter sp.]
MPTDSLPPALPKKRSKWKAVLLLLVVFLLGAVTGVFTCGAVILAKLRESARNPAAASRPMERFFDRTERQLDRELNLDAEEKQAVHEELETTSGRLREIRMGVSRDVRALAHDSVERIAARLPEEKRAAFREKASKRLGPWGLL